MDKNYHELVQEKVPGIEQGMMYEDCMKLIYEKLIELEEKAWKYDELNS